MPCITHCSDQRRRRFVPTLSSSVRSRLKNDIMSNGVQGTRTSTGMKVLLFREEEDYQKRGWKKKEEIAEHKQWSSFSCFYLIDAMTYDKVFSL